MTQDFEAMARDLEATGRYRVLRKLESRASIAPPADAEIKIGLYVDVETTGLDLVADEVIELAMVPFTFSPAGDLFEVRESFQSFREPSRPISEEITRLTGITNEMVAGQRIAPDDVAAIAEDVDVVIAHNAEFDRRFAEQLSPVFAKKAWACSMREVDWSALGFEGTKLAYLAMGAGFFYDRHRAVHDCHAAIELLAKPLIGSRTPLTQLLEVARRPTWRIWATNSPFEAKDVLKARGYRWNGEAKPGFPKSWWIDVDDDKGAAEYEWLHRDIYKHEISLPVVRISAFDRFSDRAGAVPRS